MRDYKLIINCEYVNETGILVNHVLKADTARKPQVYDKFMFVSKQHFKPIVIEIRDIVEVAMLPGMHVVCDGEEVDEADNIKETFYSFLIED